MVEFIASIITIIMFAGIFLGPIAIIILIIKKITDKDKKKRDEQIKKANEEQIKIQNTQKTNNNYKSTYNPNLTEQQIFEEFLNQQRETKEDIDEYYKNQYIPYRQKYFLSKNELNFYKELKTIADENNLVVLSKIRVADLVEVEPMDKRQWQIYFNKISKKHVDFALANPQNLQIKLLIELDDYSHNDQQYERDRFVEAIYNKTGYKLLRVKGTFNLKEKVEGTLKQY